MALIWILPVSITLMACVLGYRWHQQLEAEVAQLRAELQALPALASRTRAVQAQAARTGRATSATADDFGSRLHK
jgi:hypothetical protein